MAQIKTLKINANGFTEEHGVSDEVTFATLTATTQVAVTGGTTITNNITFNSVTDTIAGIQNQNLLDKTSDETISGNWTIATGSKLILTDYPTLGSHAANKAYVDSLVNGLTWQEPVVGRYDFTTAEPVTTVVGERYINTVTGTSSVTSQAVLKDYVYRWNGTSWDEISPAESWALYDDDANIFITYNGTDWVSMGSIVSHNALSGLQGGTTGEYYHMTAAEDTFVSALTGKAALGTDVLVKNVNDTITANYTFNGDLNVSGGALELPTSADLTPLSGGVYVDTAAKKLYAYDGSAYFDVGGSGSASSVVSTYTAGAGGIAQYDAVYVDANDTVLKAQANADSTARVIGFAPAAISATNSGLIQENGVLAGVLSGATAGTPYFLSASVAGGVTSTPPSGSGNVVIQVGVAKNATDLQIRFQFFGKKA